MAINTNVSKGLAVKAADAYLTNVDQPTSLLESPVTVAGRPWNFPAYITLARDGAGKLRYFTSCGSGSRIALDGAPVEYSRFDGALADQVVTVGTLVDDMASLRTALDLSISDLARWFDVSRPIIQAWLKTGGPQQADHQRQLVQFAAAARNISKLRLHRPGQILRRVLFDAESALDLIRRGQAPTPSQMLTLQDLDAGEETQRQASAAVRDPCVRPLTEGSGSPPIMNM